MSSLAVLVGPAMSNVMKEIASHLFVALVSIAVTYLATRRQATYNARLGEGGRAGEGDPVQPREPALHGPVTAKLCRMATSYKTRDLLRVPAPISSKIRLCVSTRQTCRAAKCQKRAVRLICTVYCHKEFKLIHSVPCRTSVLISD